MANRAVVQHQQQQSATRTTSDTSDTRATVSRPCHLAPTTISPYTSSALEKDDGYKVVQWERFAACV